MLGLSNIASKDANYQDKHFLVLEVDLRQRGFTSLDNAMRSWFQVSCTWYGSRVAVHSMVPG